MPHPFLSDEWITEAKAIRDKYAGQSTVKPPAIKMNQVITDVPFGESTVKTYVDTTSGEMVMEKGELPDAEVTVTTDYATAKAIFVNQDQAAGMQAFMSGKIKVAGDMTKLMSMQSAPADEIANKVAAEIKEITEP